MRIKKLFVLIATTLFLIAPASSVFAEWDFESPLNSRLVAEVE